MPVATKLDREMTSRWGGGVGWGWVEQKDPLPVFPLQLLQSYEIALPPKLSDF